MAWRATESLHLSTGFDQCEHTTCILVPFVAFTVVSGMSNDTVNSDTAEWCHVSVVAAAACCSKIRINQVPSALRRCTSAVQISHTLAAQTAALQWQLCFELMSSNR